MNDPGLGQRQFVTNGRLILRPVQTALVAPTTQPAAPSPTGVITSVSKRLDIATDTIVLVVDTQFRTQRPILLGQWLMAVIPTPRPYPFHEPAQAFAHGLALDHPEATAGLGPIMGKSERVKRPLPLDDVSRRSGLLNLTSTVLSG